MGEFPSDVIRRGAASMRSPDPRATLTAAVADLLEELARQMDGPKCDDPRGVCNGCERREDFNDALRIAEIWLDYASQMDRSRRLRHGDPDCQLCYGSGWIPGVALPDEPLDELPCPECSASCDNRQSGEPRPSV